MSDKKKIAEMRRRKTALENKITAVKEAREFRGGIAMLIESELEKAEIVLAAKAIVDKIGKMAEDLATIEGEDIVPMLDSMKLAFGPQLADKFHEDTSAKLRSATEAMIQTKDALTQHVAKLEGVLNGEPVSDMMSNDMADDSAEMNDAPATDMGGEDDELGMDDDMGAEDDMGDEMGGDEEAALDDLFAGGNEDDSAAGRARKESAQPRGKRLNETRVTFQKHVAGRADNPFLVMPTAGPGAIDARGADYDTLRAHAAQAMFDAPLTAKDKSGMPRGRWTQFTVEGYTFRAKPQRNDIYVELVSAPARNESLSESKNPDLTVLNSFRRSIKEGAKPVEAARRTAARFGIDFSDVVEIVKEHAPSRRAVKETVANAADMVKNSQAADKIAAKLKTKKQSGDEVDAAVAKMAPGMGTKPDSADDVSGLVKAQLKGAGKLKETDLDEDGQHVVVARMKGKVVDRRSFKDLDRANAYAAEKKAPGMQVAVKSRDVHKEDVNAPVKRHKEVAKTARTPDKFIVNREKRRAAAMNNQIMEPDFDDEGHDFGRAVGATRKEPKFVEGKLDEGVFDMAKRVVQKFRDKLPKAGSSAERLDALKRYLNPTDFYSIRNNLSSRQMDELFSMMNETKAMKGEDPCWDGHEMVGTKKKNGKEVPNCVPVKESEDLKKRGYSVVPATGDAKKVGSARWFWKKDRKGSDTFHDEVQNGTSATEADAWADLRKTLKEGDKKPDADKDGIPNWADKNPFKKGKNDRKTTVKEGYASAVLAMLRSAGIQGRFVDKNLIVPKGKKAQVMDLFAKDVRLTKPQIIEESASAGRWVVETRIGNGWENTWHEDEQTQTFASRAEAKAALDEFFADLKADNMADGYSRSDYRIRRLGLNESAGGIDMETWMGLCRKYAQHVYCYGDLVSDAEDSFARAYEDGETVYNAVLDIGDELDRADCNWGVNSGKPVPLTQDQLGARKG